MFWGKKKKELKPEGESLESISLFIKPVIAMFGIDRIKSMMSFLPSLFDKMLEPDSKEYYVIHRIEKTLVISHFNEKNECLFTVNASEFISKKIDEGLESLME